jgi:AraC-like DNA-binding protein
MTAPLSVHPFRPSALLPVLALLPADSGLADVARFEDNLREPPTIPELARHVGINVNKLKRGFKSVFNTTINRYTTARRLEWAHRLLQEEALSVGEVVDRIGYENRSYFARIFRERYGMHPGDVRQHLQSVVSDAS